MYQTVIQMLAQLVCGYRYIIYTCDASMRCYRVCLQGVHSTGYLQHPTLKLTTKVATLIKSLLHVRQQ